MLTALNINSTSNNRRPNQSAALSFLRALIIACLVIVTSKVNAASVYQSPENFIADNFHHDAVAHTLWITGELAEQLKTVLGHKYHKLRLRYWRDKQQSAWILEEIGKEKYITAGFIIEQNKIKKTTILIFRESRGWEIKFPFFTRQFEAATLTEQYQLDRLIDNITGATLSVNAVERMAKAVLLLDRWINR